MGLFSSSKSKSSSSTYASETGQQISDQASAFSLSNLKAHKSRININVDQVDHGAVAGSLALAGGTVGEVFEYAKDQNAGVLAYAAGTNKTAFDYAKDTNSGVLAFAAGSAKENFDFSRDVSEASLTLGAGLAGEAFEFAGDALDWVEREQKSAFSELKSISETAMKDVKQLASQQATSNDERIQQLVGWAILAIVVIVVAMFWSRRK